VEPGFLLRARSRRGRRCVVLVVASISLIAVLACSRNALSREDHERFAESLLERGEVRAAAREFAAAAAAGQPDPSLLLKQAEAFVAAGRWRYAAPPARAAADLRPDDLQVQLLAARVLLVSNGFDEVVQRMTAFVEKHPNEPGAWIALADARARLRTPTVALARLADARTREEYERVPDRARQRVTRADDTAAAADFQRAMALAPDNTDAQVAWANFLVATGQMEPAVSLLKALADGAAANRPRVQHALGTYYRLQQRVADAEVYLKRANHASYVLRTQAALSLADLYAANGRSPEAAALLTSLPADQDKDGEIAVRLAQLDVNAGRRDAAMRRLDPLLARTPPVVGAHVLAATLLLEDGKVPEAVKTARIAAAAAPGRADARFTFGRTLAADGNLEEALDEETEAVRLAPGDGRAVLELTRTEILVGRSTQALAHAHDASRLLPDDPAAQAAPVAAQVAGGHVEAAAQALRPLVARYPASADIQTLKGTVDSALGNLDAAKAAYARALTLRADDVDALAGLAAVDLARKDPAAARRRVDEPLTRHEGDARYLYAAARVHAASGDNAGARALLVKAVTSNPGHQQAVLDLVTPDYIRDHPADATRILRQLLEHRPRSREAKTRLQLLSDGGGSAR
jgi:tetratricopeptide (TPR) repeat protein